MSIANRKRVAPIPSLAVTLLLALFAQACTGGASDRESIGKTQAPALLTAAECGYYEVGGSTQICHRTGSATHPFTAIRIDESACVNGHTQHAEDYVASADPASPLYDPTCRGGGCFPESAPCDATTLKCCDGLSCLGGTCQCPGGTSFCLDAAPSTCVDLNTDNNNCGACGTGCATGQECISGQCRCDATSCPNGCCSATGVCTTPSASACGTGGGACAACPSPTTCTPSYSCTSGSCDPNYASASTSCGASSCSGTLFTATAYCSGGGTCLSATPTSCDDGNVCTDDSCDPATGCGHVNNTASCNDGNDCTYNDQCSGGICGGTAITCTSDACTTRSCDGTSTCSATQSTTAACSSVAAVLTGITVFSANVDGSFGFGQGWNTGSSGFDGVAKLSVYDNGFQNTSPASALTTTTGTSFYNQYDTPALNLSLTPGTYTFTLVGSGWNGDGGASNFAVNLFFGGSTSTPGISGYSSYSQTNTTVDPSITADSASSTQSMNFVSTPGAGTLSNGAVTLTSFTWFNPATGINGGLTSASPNYFSTSYLPVGEMTLVVGPSAPTVTCNGVPTNTFSDANNCGDCGISCGSGTCVNGACILGACSGFQVFPRTGVFMPPAGCSGSVRALVEGGGGNGGAYPGSGGGSGFEASGTLQLSGSTSANVGGPGQASSFASLTANGGQSGQPGDGATGGIGGSSGGGKWCGWAGGAGGSNGARGGEGYNLTAAQEPAAYPGGSCSPLIDATVWVSLNGGAPSQGSPFPLGIFSLTTVAPGAASTSNYEGGGGGGGVVISGSQVRGQDSARTGYGGQGYGAGAGGGPNQSCGSGNPYSCAAVPQGAPGVVFVEWDH